MITPSKYVYSLSDIPGSDGTLYDVVEALSLPQIQFISQQLLSILELNHQANLTFPYLNPLSIKITYKNKLYYPIIDANPKSIREFAPPQLSNEKSADIYCLGLVVCFMLLRAKIFSPQQTIEEKVLQYINQHYKLLSSSIVGTFFKNININGFKEIFEILCFIEGCTGYWGKKLNRIYTMEQLKNHAYIKNIKIPTGILRPFKENIGLTSSGGFSKFMFSQGGCGIIMFSSKPRKDTYINEWVPYYLIKSPNKKYEAHPKIYNKYYGTEIDINQILYNAKAPNIITSFAEKKEFSNQNVLGKFKIYIRYQEGLNLCLYCKENINPNKLIQRTFISESDIQSISKDIAIALQGVHKQRIMFRDLNPSNVMVYLNLKGELHAKIFDFGVSSQNDAANTIVGVAAFESPEMTCKLHNGTYDNRIDIYAFGALLYFMLTSFQDVNKVQVLKIDGQMGISYDLLDLIEGCIQIDVNRRPSSFDEILSHPFFKSDFSNKMVCAEILISKKQRLLHEKYVMLHEFYKYQSASKSKKRSGDNEIEAGLNRQEKMKKLEN